MTDELMIWSWPTVAFFFQTVSEVKTLGVARRKKVIHFSFLLILFVEFDRKHPGYKPPDSSVKK
ncbi:hypothetical protein [Microcoleus sp. B9-D4]|uniref:hypothetical protein n=1 Tax=Microcoleus sp. B9-D4 TaxID=2818711 RepID=UPI002FD797E1